jgi:hypothetical protein
VAQQAPNKPAPVQGPSKVAASTLDPKAGAKKATPPPPDPKAVGKKSGSSTTGGAGSSTTKRTPERLPEL